VITISENFTDYDRVINKLKVISKDLPLLRANIDNGLIQQESHLMNYKRDQAGYQH